MKTKFLKLFWVVLLVICSFTLGYTLKPTTSKRKMSPMMMQRMMGGKIPMSMPAGRMAPPLNMPRR